MNKRKLNLNRKRRQLRVRSRIAGGKKRVTVYRSLKQFYGQLIDDQAGKTLASASTMKMSVEGDKKNAAKAAGIELAKKAIEQGIKEACFDRGRFLYTGRVQAFAEGLREGGLTI